jgi:hypothetical protein
MKKNIASLLYDEEHNKLQYHPISSNTYDYYFILALLNFLRTIKATIELPMKVAVQ